MSTMAATDRPHRARRQFTDEFKAGAVRLVFDEGKTVGQVARELDLTASALRNWVARGRADRTAGRRRPSSAYERCVGSLLSRRAGSTRGETDRPVRVPDETGSYAR